MLLEGFFFPYEGSVWTHPFLGVFFLCLFLLVCAWGLLQLFLRQSLPKLSGTIEVEGIQSPVIIERDEYGIPTIKAESLLDCVYGQGFVQAQDRLWQMELNRRIGAGRLSELFGEQALPADRFLRRLGLRRAAQLDREVLTEQERDILQAFCRGVNEGIASLRHLPAEFRLLKFKPEPWEILDSLTWIEVMSMDLCSNWEQELLRGRILEKLGPRGARLLHLFNERPTSTVPPRAEAPDVMAGLWKLYEEAKSYLPNGGFPGASNAWVVSGSRTKSGSPLLANDPHLVGRVPCIWYESYLKAPGLDVRGACFPGVPLVVIGANSKLGWGITNNYADTQDLYVERYHPQEQGLYETEDGYRQVEVVEERIEVKGGETQLERVEITRHGPVLFRNETLGLALRWKNFEPSHPVETLLKLNCSDSVAEFKSALKGWQAPSSNFLYADVEGNIGYCMAGHVPKRKKGSGLTPVPGWNGEFEWEGEIPFEELPQIDNPECGYLVTANNPAAGPDYPHYLTWDWMGSARAQRIEELLLAREEVDVPYFEQMQTDVHCSTGLRFVRACEKFELEDKKAKKALAYLKPWDGTGDSESGPMALYQATMLTLLKKILGPLLGEELRDQFLGQSSNPLAALAGHTGRYTSWLVQLLEEPERQRELQELAPELPPLRILLEGSLEVAYALLRKTFGADLREWKWGKLHVLQFKHPLGVNPLLSLIFNAPYGSAGGDTDTVFQTAFNPQKPYKAEAWCPSFRHIVRLSERVGYFSVIPTGQSGHPASINYLDQFHRWCTGETRVYSEQRVNVLRLQPTVS
jgi:penicillin amidase